MKVKLICVDGSVVEVDTEEDFRVFMGNIYDRVWLVSEKQAIRTSNIVRIEVEE